MAATKSENKDKAPGAKATAGRGGKSAAARASAAPAGETAAAGVEASAAVPTAAPQPRARSPLAQAAAAALDGGRGAAMPVDLSDEAQLRAALKQAPEDPALWSNLGRLLRQRKETGEAIECYRKAAASPLAPAPVWFNLANALMDKGEFEEALAACDGAIELQEVHFRYPNRAEVAIFSGLSLSVPAGRTVALVGEIL